MRLAIIGTGISGMASAYLAQRAGHDITVYEAAPVVGGHTRTLEVDYGGVPIAVDTGFIVFNEPNYPNLVGFFKHLGVATHKSDMSFAISVDQGKFEWGARSLDAVFGQRSNLLRPRFYRMVRDVVRFNREALARAQAAPQMSLRELLAALKVGEDFCRYYILPMGGAIWSAPTETMLDFPAHTFVQFFKNHGLLSFTGQHQWYTVTGGSRQYVQMVTAPYRDRIRTSCAVTRVARNADGVAVTDMRGETLPYDQVIFACHADQTLRMLTDATDDERAVLGVFHYQRNIAYLHRDSSVMPKRTRCWASWVYRTLSRGGQEQAQGIEVSYWMNLLQSIDQRHPLFVTLNPAQPINEALVFDRHEFEHPIFTNETARAQLELPKLQGQRRSWFCGAYTRYGFHEDGIMSAVAVARGLGMEIPWA